jgi:uncharacterized protein (DUF433 family)
VLTPPCAEIAQGGFFLDRWFAATFGITYPALLTQHYSPSITYPASLRHAGATMFSMIDWSTCLAVERDQERVSGAWVFRGSRVPIAALFENLEDDASVQQFVEWFPGVTINQARQVLEHAARSSLAIA